jgi:hypothetical protein
MKLRTAKPQLEALEERWCPSTVVWKNTQGDYNWGSASNWSGGVLPGTGDTVEFDDTGNVHCNLNVNATIASLTMTSGFTSYLSMGGHNLTINSSTIASVLTGGSIDFTSSHELLEFGGAITDHWYGTSLGGDANYGTVKIDAGATLDAAGATGGFLTLGADLQSYGIVDVTTACTISITNNRSITNFGGSGFTFDAAGTVATSGATVDIDWINFGTITANSGTATAYALIALPVLNENDAAQHAGTITVKSVQRLKVTGHNSTSGNYSIEQFVGNTGSSPTTSLNSGATLITDSGYYQSAGNFLVESGSIVYLLSDARFAGGTVTVGTTAPSILSETGNLQIVQSAEIDLVADQNTTTKLSNIIADTITIGGLGNQTVLKITVLNQHALTDREQMFQARNAAISGAFYTGDDLIDKTFDPTGKTWWSIKPPPGGSPRR